MTESNLSRKLRLAAQLAERLARMNAALRQPRQTPIQQARSADDDLYRQRLRGR